VTTVRRAAAGLSALVSSLLLLVLSAPLALASVAPPDPSTAGTSPVRTLSAPVVHQTSGLALWAVVLIALAAAAVGALAAMAASHAFRLRRPRMLPA